MLFALSNPTSRAECTAGQAYEWSRGQAIFASGSPFGTVTYDGREYRVGQGNNAYVFPGIGLGAVVSRARRIPDEFFLTAARTLAGLVTAKDLEIGALYPPLREIRRISLAIATQRLRLCLHHEAGAHETPAQSATDHCSIHVRTVSDAGRRPATTFREA